MIHYYVYVIINQEANKFYIGQTNDLNKRLVRHNNKLPNKKTSFTAKNKGFWKLIYQETYPSRVEAIKREKYLKSYRGRQFIKKIIEQQKNSNSVGV